MTGVRMNVVAPMAGVPSLDVIETALPVMVDGEEHMFRAFAFQGQKEEEQLLVLVHGQAGAGQELPLVRLHSGCVTGDIFHSMRCDCYEQLQTSLRKILASPHGAVVYMPYHEGRGIGLFKKMRAYALQEHGVDTVDANTQIGAPVDARDFVLAARALTHLGLTEIRLLCNNPAKMDALSGLGVKIAERISVVSKPNPHNERYLETKRNRMGHQL